MAWSPHASDMLLSASYDMTARIWTDGGDGASVDAQAAGVPGPKGVGSVGASLDDPQPYGEGSELGVMARHTEFVTGIDWCLFGADGWCASCAWDERVCVWDVRGVVM